SLYTRYCVSITWDTDMFAIGALPVASQSQRVAVSLCNRHAQSSREPRTPANFPTVECMTNFVSAATTACVGSVSHRALGGCALGLIGWREIDWPRPLARSLPSSP